MFEHRSSKRRPDHPPQSRRECPFAAKSIASAIGCVQTATTASRDVNFRLTRDEAMLLDQVACKLGETITLTVTVKEPPSSKPPNRHSHTRNAPLSPMLQC